MTRMQAVVLRTFSFWTIWVWGTRIWNIARDADTTTAFKVVHSVLAAVSVLLAVAALVVVRQVRGRTRAVASDAVKLHV